MVIQREVLTTGEIARLLHVTHVTVYRWVKAGKLKAYRVAGGNFRILKNDFSEFLKTHKLERVVINLPNILPAIKILIVDYKTKDAEKLKSVLEERNAAFHVTIARNFLRTGMLLHSFHPGLVIVNLDMPGINIAEICREMKTDHLGHKRKMVGIAGRPDHFDLNQLKKNGIAAVFPQSLGYTKMAVKIEKILK
jgi:excisionase family DNA binding protein